MLYLWWRLYQEMTDCIYHFQMLKDVGGSMHTVAEVRSYAEYAFLGITDCWTLCWTKSRNPAFLSVI
jgi:hypothetical protein